MSSTRRDFIKTASAIAAGTALPLEGFAIGRTKTAPNDRINVALIGGNGMGWSDLESFLKNPEVECAALCDVDRNILNKRTDDLIKMGRPRPKLYIDYRNMLENKDIDVVITATPDHWHCLMLCDSLETGNMPTWKTYRKLHCRDKYYAECCEKARQNSPGRTMATESASFHRCDELSEVRQTWAYSYMQSLVIH